MTDEEFDAVMDKVVEYMRDLAPDVNALVWVAFREEVMSVGVASPPLIEGGDQIVLRKAIKAIGEAIQDPPTMRTGVVH